MNSNPYTLTENEVLEAAKFINASRMTGYIDDELLEIFHNLLGYYVVNGASKVDLST